MNVKDIELFRDNTRDDAIQQYKKDDTRKPKITLRHLNKLRKKRELQKLELLQGNDKIEIVYGKGGGDEGGDIF